MDTVYYYRKLRKTTGYGWFEKIKRLKTVDTEEGVYVKNLRINFSPKYIFKIKVIFDYKIRVLALFSGYYFVEYFILGPT